MTTPRPAREGHPSEVAGGVVPPAPAEAPSRDTLVRVLECLRDLPQQPRPRRTSETVTVGSSAVPLPRRRRSERGAPSVD